MPLAVSGRVTDTKGSPIAGATLDVWMTNEDGFYDNQPPQIQPELNLRGVFHTNDDGRYWFRSARPRYYPSPKTGRSGAFSTCRAATAASSVTNTTEIRRIVNGRPLYSCEFRKGWIDAHGT